MNVHFFSRVLVVSVLLCVFHEVPDEAVEGLVLVLLSESSAVGVHV